VTAGETFAGQIKEVTGGGADVAVDAFGGSKTILPALLTLRKGGRHVQLGLTGKRTPGWEPIDASQINRVFSEMSDYKTRSFHVITSWTGTAVH
jgi:threonine dehydrogenase-like Zn-dependent dehydrogenase